MNFWLDVLVLGCVFVESLFRYISDLTLFLSENFPLLLLIVSRCFHTGIVGHLVGLGVALGNYMYILQL